MSKDILVRQGRGWTEPLFSTTAHYFPATGIQSLCGRFFPITAVKSESAFTKGVNVLHPCADCYEIVHKVEFFPDNVRSIWTFDGESLQKKSGRTQ